MSEDRVVPLKKRGERCPICGAPSAAKTKPFCSNRCAEVDLGRWLKGGYRIPTDETPTPDELDAAIQREREEEEQ